MEQNLLDIMSLGLTIGIISILERPGEEMVFILKSKETFGKKNVARHILSPFITIMMNLCCKQLISQKGTNARSEHHKYRPTSVSVTWSPSAKPSGRFSAAFAQFRLDMKPAASRASVIGFAMSPAAPFYWPHWSP